MILSEKDGELFYELWLPLLDYCNQNYGGKKNVKKMSEEKELDPQEVKVAADMVWEDVSIIDEYLKCHKDMPDEHQKIISGWKRCVTDHFIIERHLKKGSVFISMSNENVYLVGGIISSIEEMFYPYRMPMIVEATLLPFRDQIITDGLIVPYSNFLIDGNMARDYKEIYMEAKLEKQIIKTL